MKSLKETINSSIVTESKYVTFDEKNIDKMSTEELWSAFEEAAAAKSACYLRKDKKGEAELAEIIAQIRKRLS
jgi:hypothetical protein